jgi:Cu(I)/Ag(I) efflux system membrane protein CusA/SilA
LSDDEHKDEPIRVVSLGWERFLGFFVDNKLVVAVLTALLVGAGVYVSPFDWDIDMPRDQVPVDAIPDIGENQQIVFTTWPGRSPRDVEDQISYPLTTA